MPFVRKLRVLINRYFTSRVEGIIKYRWIEESFAAGEPMRNQRPLPESQCFMGTIISPMHVQWMRAALALLVVIVIGRLFYVQGVRGASYLDIAENNRIRTHVLPAKRGLVYDRSMKPLVTNATSFSLAIIPNDLPRDSREKDRIIAEIAGLAFVPAQEIYTILDEYKKYSYEAITIREGIPYEQALTLQIAGAELPGLRVESGTERSYVNLEATAPTSTPHSMAHLIGYVGKLTTKELETKYLLGYTPSDRIGKIGIESSYEDFLRGTYGKRKVEVDATGRERLVLAEEPPTPGRHVVLAIDSVWQKTLEQALMRSLRIANAERGVAVVLDPRTGAIRAMVSLPAYDNNDFIGGISQDRYQTLIADQNNPLFNRAIGGTYPSGSTIKPFMAAAALEEGLITERTTMLSSGGIEVGEWFFPDWKAGGHGVTNVIKAIAESVNTFFYTIGGGYRTQEGLGVEKITRYLRTLGWGEPLGVDIPGEAAGLLPSPAWKERVKEERWYIGDTYNLSIGQGDLLVTPLQLAVATAAIANDGVRYRPSIVERAIDPLTGEVQPIEPQPLPRLPIQSANLEIVRRGMRACVTVGSCRLLADAPVTVAGKTGTAQWSRERPTHAWFAGFAPFNNPEIAITVIVEEGGEGSKTAIPVAREFIDFWSKTRDL
ncbi:MAG: penicillin-binding protein 2 [Patescibacteria group bacterium]